MLSDTDLERYARQAIMPDIGEEGQERLLAARVLLVGAGGLGSPAGFYLAAAGVGHVSLVDDEHVEISNLNRQILHTTDSIGTAKVVQAARMMSALNPGITVEPVQARLTGSNADALVGAHDLVVDCSDNADTRYLLGATAHRTGRPLIFGGAVRTEGQLAVFQSGVDGYRDTPCYRCVFPDAPDAALAPGCSEAGILGPVTGVIGAMQALEAVKLLLGLGTSLTGHMLLFDGRHGSFMDIATQRRADCAVCGPESRSENQTDST
jgi:adenylyltransferase/sulfurtransferase